jgi:2-iminobutanoate/2-iminopropanoate deaminase
MKKPLRKSVIQHADLPKPYGAYSTAIRAGDFLFISGLAGIDPKSGQKVGDDFESQARQAFENLKACVDCSGSKLENVVRVVCYLTDSAHRSSLNALFQEFFPDEPPTRSTPIVELPIGLLLSLEATAIFSN